MYLSVTKCRHGRCMCHLTLKPWRVRLVTGHKPPLTLSSYPSQAEALRSALSYVASRA